MVGNEFKRLCTILWAVLTLGLVVNNSKDNRVSAAISHCQNVIVLLSNITFYDFFAVFDVLFFAMIRQGYCIGIKHCSKYAQFVLHIWHNYCYPYRLCQLAWVKCSSPSVCLFVCLFIRSITQKRMNPKCSNLVQGMTLGYPRSGIVLEFKGQGSRSQGQ